MTDSKTKQNAVLWSPMVVLSKRNKFSLEALGTSKRNEIVHSASPVKQRL